MNSKSTHRLYLVFSLFCYAPLSASSLQPKQVVHAIRLRAPYGTQDTPQAGGDPMLVEETTSQPCQATANASLTRLMKRKKEAKRAFGNLCYFRFLLCKATDTRRREKKLIQLKMCAHGFIRMNFARSLPLELMEVILLYYVEAVGVSQQVDHARRLIHSVLRFFVRFQRGKENSSILTLPFPCKVIQKVSYSLIRGRGVQKVEVGIAISSIDMLAKLLYDSDSCEALDRSQETLPYPPSSQPHDAKPVPPKKKSAEPLVCTTYEQAIQQGWQESDFIYFNTMMEDFCTQPHLLGRYGFDGVYRLGVQEFFPADYRRAYVIASQQ